MIRSIFIVLGTSLLIGGVFMFVTSDPVEEVRQEEFAKRIEALAPRAGGGDVAAQVELAGLYRAGLGVKADPARAARLYSQAAEKGHNGARLALGAMFEKGEGVRRDYAKAAEFYRLAAQYGGLPDAEFALGTLHYMGRGVRQDYGEAKTWYLSAADKGHPAAQYIVGGMYAEGWGGERDYIAAYVWYSMAMPQADRAKAINVDFDPVEARARLAEKMSRFQVERAEQAVKEWMSRR